jgi:hypothetical protein
MSWLSFAGIGASSPILCTHLNLYRYKYDTHLLPQRPLTTVFGRTQRRDTRVRLDDSESSNVDGDTRDDTTAKYPDVHLDPGSPCT